MKVPKTILNCYGSVDPLPYYFTTNINDTTSSSTVNLVYGTSSSGTGYTYTDTSGYPDVLTVSSPLSFLWTSISEGDIVDVQFDSGTDGSILYYSNNFIYGVEYTGSTANTISLIYFMKYTLNWPFYYDYTSPPSNTNAGYYTFYNGQNTTFVTVNSTDASGTFSFSTKYNSGETQDLVYIVVGNITAGETFYVQSDVSSPVFVTVYDISGNKYYYTVSKNVTISLYYTGSGWKITI